MLAPSAEVRPAAAGNDKRPRFEVANVFRKGGAAYRQAHSLTPLQLKVMRAIEVCRTPVLGGHLYRCKNCGHEKPCFNSCRDRHCPKCQTLAKEHWLEARKAELLPVPYFHQVFTLPHELNPLVLWNRRVLLDMLFRATSQTLLQFARRKFGGKTGFTLVLHTWDQRMRAHFHVHCIIAGGALSTDRSSWIGADPDFLFPDRALSPVFRGKFLNLLQEALERGELSLPEHLAALATRRGRLGFVRALRENDWVVYSKKPFAGPEQVLEYLGRYTHRVAISNNRILDVTDHSVRFRYRDRSKPDTPLCIETVSIQTFIRRFLTHVLPDGFMRIRHYGFLANCCKGTDLVACRRLLGVPEPSSSSEDRAGFEELMLQLTGVDLTRCPKCGERALVREPIPKQPYRPELIAGIDSS